MPSNRNGTCDTPLVAGSLLRLCLLVQGQWDLMLCFSLRECMEVTKSVSTETFKTWQKNFKISGEITNKPRLLLKWSSYPTYTKIKSLKVFFRYWPPLYLPLSLSLFNPHQPETPLLVQDKAAETKEAKDCRHVVIQKIDRRPWYVKCALCTCARYDLCWHQVFVIMRLAFHTLQPAVEFFIWSQTERHKSVVVLI